MRIILAKDTGNLILDAGRETLCIRHKSYTAPQTQPGCVHMTFDEFDGNHRSAVKGFRRLVIVGMNKIITPSNRTKDVFELLHNDTRKFEKISVDRTTFTSEPWRAWFHFGFVGAKYREYTYSYLAESHWKAARDGIIETDPFCIDEFLRWSKGVIASQYSSYFDPMNVTTVVVDDATRRQYQAEKSAAFDSETTITGVLRRLGAFAQSACPVRSIPATSSLFNSTTPRIVCTDLPIDAYFVSRLRGLIDLTNEIGRRHHVDSGI